MTFPIVSGEVVESIVRQLKSDKNYPNKKLDEIQAENPELGDFIVSTANKFAESVTQKFDTTKELEDYIRGNVCWQMIAVYNSMKQQMVVDELDG